MAVLFMRLKAPLSASKRHVFHSGLYFTPDWDAAQRGINHAPRKFLSHISLRIELGLHLSTPNDSNPDWNIHD